MEKFECKSCANIIKSEYSMSEKNHQFGLIGEKNSSYLLKNSKRDKLGRLIGVKKSGNFGEGCDANPEISIDSNESIPS